MKKILMITALLLFCGAVNTWAEDLAPCIHSENPNYGTLLKESEILNDFSMRYFVRWAKPYQSYGYTILDSQLVTELEFCDSNALAFTTFDETYNYLIVAKLTKPVHYDTVYTAEIGSYQNWLTDLADIEFSLRDSILIRPTGKYGMCDHILLKLVKRDSLAQIGRIENVAGSTFSSDFSLIFFSCNQANPKSIFSKQTVTVYDIANDSLYSLATATENADHANSRAKNTPIFYIGSDGDISNLWCHTQDGKSTQLTDIHFPEFLFAYFLYPDSIHVQISSHRKPGSITRSFGLRY